MLDIKHIPNNPGVYIMLDDKQTIIYIGKAKNLKKRVSSYFQKDHSDLKTEFLIQKIDNINYIVTNSEKDALILENQLIKKHSPFYNILLKDHKSYLKLSIDYNFKFPRIQTTREKQKKNVRYFGPYPSTHNAKALADIGEKLFKLRRCNRKIPNIISPNTKPCMLYHLEICLGACIGVDSEEAYKQRLKQYIAFLRGNYNTVNKELLHLMQEASGQLNFEEAARIRDLIESLSDIQVQQKIYFESNTRIDIWGYYENENKYIFTVLVFLKGLLQQKQIFHTKSPLSKNMIFNTILQKIYINQIEQNITHDKDISIIESQILGIDITKEYSEAQIVIPKDILIDKEEEEMLCNLSPIKIKFLKNHNNWNELLIMAQQNAVSEWKSFYKVSPSEGALIDIQNTLQLENLPMRIETVDISNIGDSFCVGSSVVFIDGTPAKDQYRYFKIKYTQGQNDFAMIQEVLLRRFKNSKVYPDLLVIDGGKGQVSAAKEILDDMNINIPLIGLAKKEELIIIPNQTKPIKLSHTSATLRLIMATRNEAHRFANKLRENMLHKKTLGSAWDSVKDVGKQRKQILIQNFPTPSEFLEAPLEEIQQKTGLPISIIQKILGNIHP